MNKASKDIFRLQVAVDDVVVVEMLDCDENLSQVEHSDLHRQAQLLSNLLQKLSAWQVLEQKIQVRLILQRRVKLDEKVLA